MSQGDLSFPFAAVLGMDDAKRAIMCAAVCPCIRTVLIRGGPGSAKTVLSRAAGRLTGRRVVNVPLNVTEEMLFGGMDAEATIREGRAVMQRGLLSEADGGILYVDDVNLMDQRMLASLLDCVSSGRVVVEREGVSGEYRCDTLMIATMNPGDTDISPHLLDRFDLCAYSDFPDDDVRGREEILRRNSAFAGDPEGFVSMYADEESELRERIAHAARILPLVTISDDLLGVAVELAAKVSADGFRGDIAMAETASALAALNGRDEVLRKDVEEAAMICLAHRRNYSQPPTPPEPPRQDRDEEQDRYEEPPQGPSPDDGRDDSLDGREEPSDLPQDLRDMLDEMMFEIGEQFRVIDYLQDGRRVIRTTSSRKGRRAMAESKDSTGRYARSRIPEGRVSDVAFDATVRAAAPYQRGRDHGTLAIAIEKQDIRRKVRERRSGCTILFLVDASGSLGVRRRMAAVKGAVLSMLRDSYVKRDRIGMMAFRRDSAELILPPTRSVEYSYRKLEGLPTGGRTPLGQALITVNEFMTSYSRSHPGESCYIVLITDGRANVPLREGADANEEARELAADMTIPQVRWIVVDASTGYIRFDNAERLAEELEGTYFRLEDLNADRLAESVRSVIGRSRRDDGGNGPRNRHRSTHREQNENRQGPRSREDDMTKNQFLTDANAYLEAISPNYAKSTMDEKSRKLRFYARVLHALQMEGRIKSNSPSKLTADDLHTYVTFRRSMGVKDTTIAKDLSIIGMFLRWKGNDAKEIYDVQYGNRKPHAYNGKLEPLSDDVIERVYSLARETDSWQVLEGCVAIILGCAAGLRPQESRQLYASDVHLMGDKSTIFVQHVKGEGTWGRRRSVPVMDGVEDILERYLTVRAERLRALGIESDAMFPPLRSGREFLRQQSFGRLKERVEGILGVRFELRDGRRAYGQRMLDAGYPIELVSKSMGHATIETTQKFYADYQERNVLDRIFQMKNDQKVCTKT